MELVKESKEYKIYKKRSGRHAVKGANGKWVNGADKIKILVGEGLIKAAIPAKKEEPPAEVAPAAEEAAPTEESSEEES